MTDGKLFIDNRYLYESIIYGGYDSCQYFIPHRAG